MRCFSLVRIFFSCWRMVFNATMSALYSDFEDREYLVMLCFSDGP